ncbi:MAG: baseplate J/gp47 family protein [Ramlibacter sp.]|nr:baseplate J/gp47 family protein [Ramlibacter sp.]
MGFVVPTFDQVRETYLAAVRGLQPDAPIGSDSDNFVRASAVAGVVEQLYAHQAWVARQSIPDLADVDVMERMAYQRGLVRKAAVSASGTIRFAGVPGATVPLGTAVDCPAAATAAGVSQQYLTTAEALVGGGGTVDVPAAAVAPGEAANLGAAVLSSMPNPPISITSATIMVMGGGLATESDGSLLDRLLFELRNPPAGGNAADYQRWARAVPGVVRAFVYPLRRGVGTVDVAPLPATGLPGDELIDDVQAYIDARRPLGMATGGFVAVAPTAVTVAVTATVTLAGGYFLADVAEAAESALAAYIGTMAPGDTVVRAKVIALISDTPGVADVSVIAPAANVATVVDADTLEIAQLGAVGITL